MGRPKADGDRRPLWVNDVHSRPPANSPVLSSLLAVRVNRIDGGPSQRPFAPMSGPCPPATAKIHKHSRKGACLFSRSYPIVLADQGAPLLTRFARSSTRRVALRPACDGCAAMGPLRSRAIPPEKTGERRCRITIYLFKEPKARMKPPRPSRSWQRATSYWRTGPPTSERCKRRITCRRTHHGDAPRCARADPCQGDRPYIVAGRDTLSFAEKGLL
jgi:hypothetical protein